MAVSAGVPAKAAAVSNRTVSVFIGCSFGISRRAGFAGTLPRALLVNRTNSAHRVRATSLTGTHVNTVPSAVCGAQEGEGLFERRAGNVHAVAQRRSEFVSIHQNPAHRAKR